MRRLSPKPIFELKTISGRNAIMGGVHGGLGGDLVGVISGEGIVASGILEGKGESDGPVAHVLSQLNQCVTMNVEQAIANDG